MYALLFVCLIGLSSQPANGQVMNYETNVTIDGNGKKSTERTVLIQINNKDQNRLSHVELGHSPNQKFSLNYAYLLNKEGHTIRKLKKKELVTRSNLSYQAFYQDDLITEFNLYGNQYPYSIEYSYTIEEDEYLYISLWTPLYSSHVTTVEASLQVNIPYDYPIQINSSKNLIFEASENEKVKTLTWRSSMVKNSSYEETHAPPTEKLIPIVKIVPTTFKYGVPGKADSWSSFGKWLGQLNEGTDELTLQEKWAVDKLIDDTDDKMEIIKTLYHYLQDHTKYVNVAIEVGGLKSYPASYVCQNKYGDCKALTTYMKAMLANVGIESTYTIINAGEKNTPIDINIPSQQFNHVVLMVPIEKDTIWLENTSNALPFNYLGTFTQNRHALAIKGEESELVKTPELLIDDVLLERNYTMLVKDDNELQIDLDLTLRGKEFEDFRYFIAERDKERLSEEVNRRNGIINFQINNWDIVDFHRDSTFLQLNAKGTSASMIRQIGAFKVINPLRITLPDFKKPNERKLDVAISFPINYSDRSVYDLESFAQNEIQFPEGVIIENKYGLYSADYSKDGNHWIVAEKFTLFANHVSIDKYDDFYEFIDSVNTYKKKTAILIK